ncbi:spermatid nuclear transition protein 1 [Perognathus longimembris pacificus]|uniref:spermatid nuclear transition protein 1 n=1 Tax=Perognathus longimembris pacificus TaxID=214514 RepID=UPI002018C2BC|nr:spermatid nuclear transition protein 1 [Perognathus longimembris pacificus]
MATNCKSKSHGTRRAKTRSPHKGVKRSNNKKKCRKVSLKCRKHGDDDSGVAARKLFVGSNVFLAHAGLVPAPVLT